ncbi:MAG: hypothetical protein AB1566_14805 [Chloroflexota bacterium]
MLSDGAILDLPPFSNFQSNVMWIDDHLKWELHKALGHFAEVKFAELWGAPVQRVKDVELVKDRVLAGQGNLREYTLGSYIPTLLWGIIVDGWIRGTRPDGRGGQAAGGSTAFVAALEMALRRGTFGRPERSRLRDELTRAAIDRINALICEWRKLKTRSGRSFAALWVGSDGKGIRRVLGRRLAPKGEEWLGWGLLLIRS